MRPWIIRSVIGALVVPWLLVLPLNLFLPSSTAIMARRVLERAITGKRPIFPRHDVVRHEQISPYMHRAVLASEDTRFFRHWGFDFTAIRAAMRHNRRGRSIRGASTISQQVAKNLMLWEGRSYFRKGFEVYVTLVVEASLSKKRILDIYLNSAEWGDGIFGAEAAARAHFGTSAAALTREQAARLAAVLPAPRRWSPNSVIARRRAARILRRMSAASLSE